MYVLLSILGPILCLLSFPRTPPTQVVMSALDKPRTFSRKEGTDIGKTGA